MKFRLGAFSIKEPEPDLSLLPTLQKFHVIPSPYKYVTIA